MNFWNKETDEEYYQRHYRKIMSERPSALGTCAVDAKDILLSAYPRSDPASPRRLRADHASERGTAVAVAVGIAASIFLTPVVGVPVGVLLHEMFKSQD